MNTAHKRKCWIGFDLGGTKMLCQAFDSEFSCLSRNRDRTRGYEGAKSGVERIIKLIAETLKAINLPSEELGGICIGCPGPLDLDEGVMTHYRNTSDDEDAENQKKT